MDENFCFLRLPWHIYWLKNAGNWKQVIRPGIKSLVMILLVHRDQNSHSNSRLSFSAVIFRESQSGIPNINKTIFKRNYSIYANELRVFVNTSLICVADNAKPWLPRWKWYSFRVHFHQSIFMTITDKKETALELANLYLLLRKHWFWAG